MADERVGDLVELTAPDPADSLPIVDESADPADATKRITVGTLDGRYAGLADFDDHTADASVHSSGRSVFYVERTSNYTITNTVTMVPTWEATVPAGVRPVVLRVVIPYLHAASGTLPFNVNMNVFEGASDPGTDLGTLIWQSFQSALSQPMSLVGERRVAASGSDRTFRVRASTSAASRTALMGGSATLRPFFEAVER